MVIGPLINDRALQQTEERVRDAIDRGAQFVTGGKSHGQIYEPTILINVPKDAVCATGCDETFGPVLVVQAFEDAEQALAEAQDTPYGLTAAIMTRDNARGQEMAMRFDAGIVHVNTATMEDREFKRPFSRLRAHRAAHRAWHSPLLMRSLESATTR